MTATLAAVNDVGGAGSRPHPTAWVKSAAPAPWLCFALLAMPVVAVTSFAKFTFPPLGAQGIDISLLILLATPFVGCIFGCIRLEGRRLALYVTLLGILGLLQIPQTEISISSLLLLAALHLPYVFAVQGDYGDRLRKFFVDMVTVFAWLGIAQYGLQVLVNARYLFPIENFVPSSFLVQHFNTQAALGYGSQVYRPNGVFLLEPSFFSQVLAVAIIAELGNLRRITRLVPFAVALLASRSGTGILVLAVCLPLYLVSRRRWDVLLAGLVALVALASLHEQLHLDRFLSRLGEFSSTRSSGFARFVGGFFLFDQYLWEDPWRTLFGYGAGAFSNYASRADYPVAEMALFKMVFEFGLFGAAAYFGFLFCCLITSPAPRLLTLAVAMTYLLNGVYTPFAHGLALSLLLWNSMPAGQYAGPHARMERKGRAANLQTTSTAAKGADS